MASELLEKIRNDVLGRYEIAHGPFGDRRIVYADFTASGRGLGAIERFLQEQVLPRYANTHSETSWTGQQTTQYREQARRFIRKAVGATDEDAVIFAGSGTTGAVHKLVECLGIRIPCTLDDKYRLSARIPANERPVVFVGPYEHHSNELPWRESICDVVEIEMGAGGQIDTADLRAKLREYSNRPVKIGSFSAASNVTGIVTDVDTISEILHQNGALAFFDYATAGPHLRIRMNPPERPLAYKDAIFVSSHKFLGGPGSPGVLVAKRKLFQNRVPSVPGGGTVRFVSPKKHTYTDDIEHREEGGTPDILGSIRAALAFDLKEAVQDEIPIVENQYRSAALAQWSQNPNLRLLGVEQQGTLPIFSFQVFHKDKPLHYGFVTKLLSDLFGVQVRGGCSCAGPYAHRLLALKEGGCRCLETWASIKPGWTRASFSYGMTPEEAQYVIDAIDLVAALGWRLLPAYCFDPDRGTWEVKKNNFVPRNLPTARQVLDGLPRDKCIAPPLAQSLRDGFEVLAKGAPERNIFCSVPDELRHAAWFWLPEEIEVFPMPELTAPGLVVSARPSGAIVPPGAQYGGKFWAGVAVGGIALFGGIYWWKSREKAPVRARR